MDDISTHIVGAPAAEGLAAYVVGCGEGAVYYGNAEPEGAVVVIGGEERVARGWARYELERRGARRGGGREKASYPGRSYVTGGDVIESLYAAGTCGCAGARTGGGPPDLLTGAAERFAEALEAHERRLTRGEFAGGGDFAVVPAMTPAAARALGGETDPALLRAAAAAAAQITPGPGGGRAQTRDRGTARFPPVPPLPQREVRAADPAAVGDLEAAAAPHAEAVEAHRAILAAALDQAAEQLAEGAQQ